jgi:hypothetical protein
MTGTDSTGTDEGGGARPEPPQQTPEPEEEPTGHPEPQEAS